MTGYEVGQVVYIHGAAGMRTGVIDKVGRTLLHIRDQYGRVDTFRKDSQSGRSLGSGLGSGARFRTIEQQQRDDRTTEAYKALQRLEVQIRSRHWSVEQLEALVDAIRQIRGEE